MTAESGCREIHRLLERVPIYSAPGQAQCADGLYFFYESGEASSHAPRGRIVRSGIIRDRQVG